MKCAQICGSGCRHCQVHFLPGCVNLLLSAKYFNALSIHIKQELRKLRQPQVNFISLILIIVLLQECFLFESGV